MTARMRDPLLTIARIVLIVIQAVTAVAAVGCLLAIPSMLIFKSEVVVEIGGQGAPPEAFGAIQSILALAAIAMALAFWVAQLTRRIVGTVAEGDPFVPENAERLSRMAWIMLAIQVIGIPLGGIAMWLAEHMKDATSTGNGISLSAILLVLILFILARVFRKGTEMRADLEGTV